MSNYSDDELDLAVAAFGPTGPTLAETPFGSQDRLLSLEEMHELVAWLFLQKPDIVFTYSRLLVRTLLQQIDLFDTSTSHLIDHLTDMANKPYLVNSTKALSNAVTAATDLRRSIHAGGTNSSALTRLTDHINSYIGNELSRSVKLGDAIRTPRDEASEKVKETLLDVLSIYPTILSLALHIEELETIWSDVPINSIAGKGPIGRIITRLEGIKKNPNSRPRAVTLELLASIARMESAVDPVDPFDNRMPEILGTASGVASGTGTPAKIVGTTSAPHTIVGGGNLLVLEINEAAPITFNLPLSQYGTIRTKEFSANIDLVEDTVAELYTNAASPWDFIMFAPGGNITVVGDIVNDPAGNFLVAQPGEVIAITPALVLTGRIETIIDANNVLIESGHSLPAGPSPYVICRDNRLSLSVDGVPHTVQFTLGLNPLTPADVVADIATYVPVVDVAVVFATVRIRSRSGRRPGETSIIIGSYPEAASLLFTVYPISVYGTEGNNHLVLNVNGNLLRKDTGLGTVCTPLYLGAAGPVSMNDISIALNTHADNALFQTYATATAEPSGALALSTKLEGPSAYITAISSIMEPQYYQDFALACSLTTAGNVSVFFCPFIDMYDYMDGYYIRFMAPGTNNPMRISRITGLFNANVYPGEGADRVPDGIYTAFRIYPDLISTCITNTSATTLSIPSDLLVSGADVSNKDLKVYLDSIAGFSGAEVISEVVDRETRYDIVMDDAGVLLSGDPFTGVVTPGDTVQLSGPTGGTFHVVTIDTPAAGDIVLAPAFRDDQKPPTGNTYTLTGRFYFDPLVIRSTDNTVTSAIEVDPGSANVELGFSLGETRGSVSGWSDPALDFVRARVTSPDVLTVPSTGSGLVPFSFTATVKEVSSAHELILTTEIQNNSYGDYRITSLGLEEYKRLCESSSSPVPSWISGTLTGDDGFEANLDKLTNAIAGALSYKDQDRRAAISIATRLRSVWAALQAILSTPTYSAPILEEALEILDTLSDWGLQRGYRLLTEARFSDFFSMTASNVTDAGDVARDLAVLQNTDFSLPSNPAIVDLLSISSSSPSPDADADYTSEIEPLQKASGYEVPDAEETY